MKAKILPENKPKPALAVSHEPLAAQVLAPGHHFSTCVTILPIQDCAHFLTAKG